MGQLLTSFQNGGDVFLSHKIKLKISSTESCIQAMYFNLRYFYGTTKSISYIQRPNFIVQHTYLGHSKISNYC